ncbi:MAG: hypothetical protein ACRDDX_10390 [Cellulosilyticaceae bacterium]
MVFLAIMGYIFIFVGVISMIFIPLVVGVPCIAIGLLLIGFYEGIKLLRSINYQATIQTNMIRDIAIKINPSEYSIDADDSTYDDEEDEYEDDDTDEE